MKIIEITDRYGNDLYGVIQCEHCQEKQKLTGGYDDSYYHNHVMPAKHCTKCGMNRAGETKKESPTQ